MDVASPFESRIAGRAIASGTPFTPFTARKSTTLATLAKRNWHDRGSVLPPVTSGSFAAINAVAVEVDSDANDANGRCARYRYRYRPSATGEGRAS